MTSRRAFVVSLLGPLAGLTPGLDGRAQPAPTDLWMALRALDHFALIRHALAPGTFDPPGFRLHDCATQRNLSAEGRAQAMRMGDLFRGNGIAAAHMHSSQWCRCLETAHLMKLGEVQPQSLLNSFAEERSRAGERIAALRPWLARLQLAGPTVLVTHQVVIAALCEVSTASGEIVVVRRSPDGRLAVQGRIPTA